MLTLSPSLLYHSARIALNFDESFSADTTGVGERSRQTCLSSAQEIAAITRRMRHQHGLRFSPIVLIYGIVQAGQATRAFGTVEEYNPLVAMLTECSSTWHLAQQMKERMSLRTEARPIEEPVDASQKPWY